MKIRFSLLILIVVFFGCDDSKVIDTEVIKIIEKNGDVIERSNYLRKTEGLERARRTLHLVDVCFKTMTVDNLSNEDAQLLLNYAIVRHLNVTDISRIVNCIPDLTKKRNLKEYFYQVRGSIASGNMTFFKFMFNEFYKEYRPIEKEAFYLLELAIEYCATDFIAYLVDEQYPLNYYLWDSQKKFVSFHELVCDFDRVTASKLNNYY